MPQLFRQGGAKNQPHLAELKKKSQVSATLMASSWGYVAIYIEEEPDATETLDKCQPVTLSASAALGGITHMSLRCFKVLGNAGTSLCVPWCS